MSGANHQNTWRIELAEKFTAATKGFPGIQAMSVGGSVARGVADEFSDLELSVYWNEVPDTEARREWLKALGLEPVELKEIPEKGIVLLDDTHTYHGFQVDIWHASVNTAEEILADVLERHDTLASKLMFAANAKHAIPLLNEELLKKWSGRAAIYPRGLAIKVVRENVKYLGYHNFDTHLARNETGLLLGLLSGLQKRVFNIVLALNGEFFSSYKRMDAEIASFKIVPASWRGRNPNYLFELPVSKGVNELSRLMEETLSLVNLHLPEVETKKVLEDLKYPLRRPFSSVPHG